MPPSFDMLNDVVLKVIFSAWAEKEAARMTIRSIAARMKRLLRGLPLRSVVFCVTEYVFVCPIDSRIQAIIRKKRGICIFAVLRTEASRIALPKSDGNAESHAVYANHYNQLAS